MNRNILFLSVSIRSRAAVFWRAHLPLNPLSEVGNPAVDSVYPGLGATIAKTDVTDKDMLVAALVSQRTARVALAERLRES